MLSELEKIEKELEKLNEKRNAILNGEKERKEKDKKMKITQLKIFYQLIGKHVKKTK